MPPKRGIPHGASPPLNGSKRPRLSLSPPAAASDEPDMFEIKDNPRSGQELQDLANNQAGATEALATAPASVRTAKDTSFSARDTSVPDMPASSGGGGISGGDYVDAGGQPNQECPCGAGSCVVLQSATFRGRQYYRCCKQYDGGCDFFKWCDTAPQDFASNLVVMPCPCLVQGLRKDQLFDLFLGEVELQICTPFTQRIKDQAMLTNYTVPGAREIKDSSYTTASPLAQEVAHSMVGYLSNLQKSGWSLNGNFSLADFHLTPLGRCMMSKAKLSALVKASDEANKKDFRQVQNIIQTDLFMTEEQLPIDFKIFVSILGEFDENNRDLIVNSLALQPQARKLEAHSKQFKKLVALRKTDPKKHSKILSKLPYIDPTVTEGDEMHWKLRAERNKYLSYHLAYISEKDKKKLAKAEKKAGQSEVMIVDDAEREEKLGKSFPSGTNVLAEVIISVDDHLNEPLPVAVKKEQKLGPTYPDDGQGEVKLIKNCDEHLHEQHGLLCVRSGKLAVSFEKPGAIDARAELSANSVLPEWIELFSYEEVGYILDQAFPGAIVRLQKAMHEANVLNKAL